MSDYEFEAGVTLTSGRFCGLVFRAKSAKEYYVYYGNTHGHLAPGGKFELWRHKQGGWAARDGIDVKVLPAGGVSFVRNRRFVMRIVVRGNSFTLYVDGVLQATHTDGRYAHGQVGLWAWESGASFDGIKLNGVLV